MNEQRMPKKDFESKTGIQGAYSFKLTLFSDADEMYTLWIPKNPEGFFRFSDYAEHRFLSIEPKNGQWSVQCKAPAGFMNVDITQSNEVLLRDGQLLNIENGERTYCLFVEEIVKERNVYGYYNVPRDICIGIGRGPNNDILYKNQHIATHHAVLERLNGKWKIKDLDSLYGTYVDGERVSDTNLHLGNVICIMGLKIIIGIDFLAINDLSDEVHVNSQNLSKQSGIDIGYSYYYQDAEETRKEKFFNREPRKKLELTEKSIVIEGPPMSMKRANMPLMLRMGSSMVMGGAAALAGHYTMLLSSVLFPLLTHKYSENEKQEYEKLRKEKYEEYLAEKEREINQACIDEQRVLNSIYPSIDTIDVKHGKLMRLWERRPGDNDFMTVRLGCGEGKLSAEIKYPERHFELEPDELEEKMYHLAEKAHIIENEPITLSLADTSVCGLRGPEAECAEYILQIVSQITSFHSYDEVKLVFIAKQEQLDALDKVRFLPHVWDDQRTLRLIATDKAEVFKIGEYLQTQITEGLDLAGELLKVMKARPFYLLFVLEKNLLEGHEFLKNLLQAEASHAVSFIFSHGDLPKECQKIIYLNEAGEGICTSLSANDGEDRHFTVDNLDVKNRDELFSVVCNTKLKAVSQTQEMPKMITFLELFKAGRIEQLNPLKRWKDSNPVKSLETPVGVGADGSMFMLDLHEKRQGPHGLVAGMTGSGKSEFLITYILSMAVNYHPDEVAFVLIDYKGGGLAGAFENPVTGVKLPHLVGTITNLDGASIQRSLMTIESELVRRQKLFNDVKSKVNEGTMDIYGYQKLYREGKVSEPMPHLLIISDEFAELKQQQPEFMANLISIARIGRSLGVHLILATQKPSGVVDEQIRSNTKFRVCLRVQEKTDSMDMLKRSEAAELTDTGRFYMQVGYNEYFAIGQSAWCGAAYEPQDIVHAHKDDSIEFLDISGQIIKTAKPEVKKSDSGKKQIVAIVEYLSELADSLKICPRQLCLPELPKSLELEQMQEKYSEYAKKKMAVCLGVIDDPENQAQFPLVVDFESCQNMLITGDIGSGKTTVIQNILYMLAKRLPPEDLNFYVLDYSSRMMKLFKSLPHCGAVLYEEESNSLDNFFKLINEIVAKRKKLFSQLEVDSFEEARIKERIPLVLVVIDNLAGLSSSKEGENLSYKLQGFLKNSANYGVKYIISASHLNEVSSRIRQELGENICLQMKDKYDYSEILGCKVSYIPPNLPGRGLCKIDDKPLEFHGGIICAGKENKVRTDYIKGDVEQLRVLYLNSQESQKLPVLSENASYEDFSGQFASRRIPLGFSIKDAKPVALPLVQFSRLSLYIGNVKARKPILSNLLYAAQRENMEIWVAKKVQNSIFDDQSKDGIDLSLIRNSDSLSCTEENLRLLQQALLNQMSAQRLFLERFYDDNKLEETAPNAFSKAFEALYENTTPIFLLIESVTEFCCALPLLVMMAYEELFSKVEKRNVYIVGCFEPDTDKEALENSLGALFARSDMLLLGGKLDQQDLHRLPTELLALNKSKFNVGVMRYRDKDYPILMPCGEIVLEAETDKDLENIF